MFIHVKNLRNTSNRKPPYPYQNLTWEKFWEKKTGYDFPYFCSCSDCIERAEVGAHVIKADDDADDKWYIVPLCRGCNKKTGVLEVDSDDLAPIY